MTRKTRRMNSSRKTRNGSKKTTLSQLTTWAALQAARAMIDETNHVICAGFFLGRSGNGLWDIDREPQVGIVRVHGARDWNKLGNWDGNQDWDWDQAQALALEQGNRTLRNRIPRIGAKQAHEPCDCLKMRRRSKNMHQLLSTCLPVPISDER